MHQINPKKLLHSKWTAVSPVNKGTSEKLSLLLSFSRNE